MIETRRKSSLWERFVFVFRRFKIQIDIETILVCNAHDETSKEQLNTSLVRFSRFALAFCCGAYISVCATFFSCMRTRFQFLFINKPNGFHNDRKKRLITTYVHIAFTARLKTALFLLRRFSVGMAQPK